MFYCPVCGAGAPAAFYPCASCRKKIEQTALNSNSERNCRLCGIDLAGSESPCVECRSAAPYTPLTAVVCLGPWAGPLREWVSMLKYGGDARLARYPAELLARAVHCYWPDVPVVPVPPRPIRLFRDGFDPVQALTRQMSRLGVSVEHVLTRRGRRTQKNSSRIQRVSGENLNFKLKKKDIRGSRIVFDDISTTGTTLKVCASLLKEAGCTEVYGLVICKD